MQYLAPIALFVYNRPEHTRRTVKFLKENKLAEDSRLFIFSDGPKGEKDQDKVAEVREFIRSVDGFRSIEVVESKENKGLADSIIAGVTRLVNEYGKVIVFEDDLLSSPYTLQYFNDALRKYQNEEKVMHIGAYMYRIDKSGLPETFFYRAVTSWGWAVWKRSWDHFEPDVKKLMPRFSKEMIYKFNVDGAVRYWKQMKDFKKGKNNSWAVRWYASMFLNGGLALNPSHSLIQNIGSDGSGVHSGVTEIFDVSLNADPVTIFPDKIEENPHAVEKIRRFFKNHKGGLFQRAVRFIRQRFIMARIK